MEYYYVSKNYLSMDEIDKLIQNIHLNFDEYGGIDLFSTEESQGCDLVIRGKLPTLNDLKEINPYDFIIVGYLDEKKLSLDKFVPIILHIKDSIERIGYITMEISYKNLAFTYDKNEREEIGFTIGKGVLYLHYSTYVKDKHEIIEQLTDLINKINLPVSINQSIGRRLLFIT